MLVGSASMGTVVVWPAKLTSLRVMVAQVGEQAAEAVVGVAGFVALPGGLGVPGEATRL
jgi:hypothetical protein